MDVINIFQNCMRILKIVICLGMLLVIIIVIMLNYYRPQKCPKFVNCFNHDHFKAFPWLTA